MRVVCLLVFVLALSCADHESEQLALIKRDVCECKTSKCAETALAGVPKDDVKASHRARGIAREMLDCLAKLYAAERPMTDPDAPPPAH